MPPEKTLDPARKLIGARLAEERARGGFNQAQFAQRIGKGTRAVAAWEIGESMPAAEFVSRFEDAGVDVLYVLTGRRGGALSEDESRLVSLYKRVPLDKRAALIITAEALASGAAPTASSSVQQNFHANVGNVHSVHQGSMTNHYTEAAAKTRPRRAK